jgi:hypothetical protein
MGSKQGLSASPIVSLELAYKNPCHHFLNYVEERKDRKRRDYLLPPHLLAQNTRPFVGLLIKKRGRKK